MRLSNASTFWRHILSSASSALTRSLSAWFSWSKIAGAILLEIRSAPPLTCSKFFQKSFSAPIPAGLGLNLQARQQRQELFTAQLSAGLLGARPGEAALFQTLGAN